LYTKDPRVVLFEDAALEVIRSNLYESKLVDVEKLHATNTYGDGRSTKAEIEA
jgi:hypothetical protein